jgi:AcrR family transcriptional regulator
VAAGTVIAADNHDDDEDDDHDDRDEPEHLDPERRAIVVARHHGPILQDIVSVCSHSVYIRVVPKLWNATIEEHRRAVRDAVLETTAGLVARYGLRSVTMSRIAQDARIGRATLYKYFPDLEAILLAWHEREISDHLRQLVEARDRAGEAGGRLEAVLATYAFIIHDRREHQGNELAAHLHGGEHVARAQQRLHGIIRELVTDGAAAGRLRDDVSPDELTSFCVHALTAASSLPSKAAVRRLVDVTLAGLRPAARTAGLSRDPAA